MVCCCLSGLNKYRGSGAPESGATSNPGIVIGRLGFTFLKCRNWQYEGANNTKSTLSIHLLRYCHILQWFCMHVRLIFVWSTWYANFLERLIFFSKSWPTAKRWPLVARPHFHFCLVDSQHASYQFVLFKPDLCRRWTLQNSKQVLLTRAELLLCILQGVFCDWYPP